MKTENERLNILILAFGLLINAYARFLPTIMVSLPVTDGGYSYVMANHLKAER